MLAHYEINRERDENIYVSADCDNVCPVHFHRKVEVMYVIAGEKKIYAAGKDMVLKEGSGRKPGPKDKVRCHYRGTFTDGKGFDSSYDRGEPAVFGVNQVIAGWTEALQMMPEGSKWELYIPYNLGYGEHGAPGAIPPYSALVFTVELLEVL